jgi:hypothetical protein
VVGNGADGTGAVGVDGTGSVKGDGDDCTEDCK